MGDSTSKQFPFPQRMTCRPGAAGIKDSFMKNLFVDKQGEKTYAVKRPGLGSKVSAPVGATGWNLLGMFVIGNLAYWAVSNIVTGVGYILDQNGVIQNTGTFPAIWNPPANDYYLSAAINYNSDEGATHGLGATIIGTYTAMWDVGGPLTLAPLPGANLEFTTISGMPAKMRPGIVYIDGTVYVMDAESGQIYGSNLQDTLTWQALNVVGNSFNTGIGTGIIRHLNYLVAFFMTGLQLFQDSGLAPPGSPLSPVPNAAFQIGCPVPETAVSIGDTLFFVSQTAPAAGLSITSMQGFSFQTISTPAVDAILLENAEYLRGPVGTQQNIVNAYGYAVNGKGHTWYVVRLPSIALAYDVVTQDWQFWTSMNTGTEATHNPMFCLNNYAASNETDILATLSQYSDTNYADYNGYINCVAQTPSGDSGTIFRKLQSRMSFYGDTIPDTMTLTYTNDDYSTFSAPITIDLSTARKFVNRLGSFYHRAYNLQYTGNQPFRMEKMETALELGSA